jgi:hypothetical protein
MATKRQQERERQKRRELIKNRILTAIAVLSLVLGLPGVLSLSSRISVTPSSSLNPSDALATPFAVSNDGSLDLHRVQYTCIYVRLNFPNGGGFETPGPYKNKWLGGFTTPNLVADTLEPTVKQNIQCPSWFGPAKADFGDIIVVVSYRPSWWLFRYQKPKHFVAGHGADGSLMWLEEPMPK